MIYGYARASTNGQRVEAQGAALNADRAQLRRLLATLAPSDQLTVTRLDRLAQSTHTFSTRLRRSPAREPDSAPWATHGPTRRRPYGRLMLTVLGGLAEFELRARTGECRAR